MYNIYILSDSIGETAEMVVRATIEQFKGVKYNIIKYPYVHSAEQIDEALQEASGKRAVIVFTTVIEELREKIMADCNHKGIPYIDILKPLLNAFQGITGELPQNEPGIIHKLDEKYFKRVEAVEFAVKYDDGKDPRGILKADVILVGVSRTSKTPLSMYLAHKNLKVANVPLVPEVPVPDELFKVSSKKIIGLTNDPMRLNEIRQERLKALGLNDNATYANVNRILEELEYSDDIMKRLRCPIINVANKAVEETANLILEIIKKTTDKEV